MEKQQPTEFVIKQDKISLLKEKVQRIRSLFGVDVTIKRNDPTSGQQWICLQGTDRELQKQAQTYIKSLCSNEPKHSVEVPPRLCERLKNGNEGMDVEKLYGAVLSFSGSTVYVQSYDDVHRTLAVSGIEQRIADFKEQGEINTTSKEDGGIVEEDGENIPPERATVHATDIAPSMREFARKLNYTDKEIDAVIKTFGTEINFNQLVEKLVKNSTSALQLGSATPEDTNCLPVVRGNCAAAPLQPADSGRNLLRRGAPVPNRSPDYFIQRDLIQPVAAHSDNLRPIVIDGSNVAMDHGNQEVFSCRGIKLCVEYFRRRGHSDITVFVPKWRMREFRPESPIKDQEVLHELARQNILKFTPSRWNGNRRIVCYDDKYTVELADQNGGIIVSNDHFRDLLKENPRWKETIEQRTMGYLFVGDRFMPPDDPLGRQGPSLDDFLRKGSATHPKICPYLKNCTFGNRCKYYHPERDTQRLRERAASTRTSSELPEHSASSTVEPSVTTSSCATNQSTATSTSEDHSRNIVGDPRVSPFTSREYYNRGRPDDILARGRQVPAGASPYEHTRVSSGGERSYQHGFYAGNVYSDYLHPAGPDYTSRNLQYHDALPMYPSDMSHFPPLQTPWPPHYNPQVPYPPPTTMAYPAGQSTYVHYYEPAPAPYRGNFTGRGQPRDQVDSNSQQSSTNREQFDYLFKMLKDICDDEGQIIRVLESHPRETDVNKLANLLYGEN
ncbi:endoribonuclease ZC3H12A-like [Orbicella faveolata]|uniref:endoribonuclease ZC3H12A-like n=1 Tax=Orbicella faveolata TaxID=48498 RepID=UPI0009E4A582|nr:endoribonuclease ZC3H12A-like [Orbicella faveolata]